MAERNPAAARIDLRLIENRVRGTPPQACAANASFDLMISMSATSSAAFLTANRVAGMGAETWRSRAARRLRGHSRPAAPSVLVTEAADRRLACQHDGCGTVIDAGRIAGGYAAAIAPGNGPQAFEVFGGSIMPMCSLVSKTAVPLQLLTSMPRICSLK